MDLDWVLGAANERFARHGHELFRVRTVALKVCSLIGFGGVSLARELQTTSKALAIAVLCVGVARAIASAPGLIVATIAAARDQTPTRAMLSEYAHRARFSLARFLFIDRRLGVLASFRESVLLTKGATLTRVGLALVEPLDAIRNYGLVRASLDGRVRTTIADALVYDYLSGKLAPVERVAQSLEGPAAPAAPTLSTFVLDPSKPRCPRCGDAILSSVEGPFKVLGCHVCAGAWLDTETSAALAENRLPVAEVMAAVTRFASSAAKPRDRSAQVPCPICGTAASRSFLPAARLTVDACAIHGTWFDEGELVSVTRAIAKTASDRAEIAHLVAAPPVQENIYVRGLRVGAAEALNDLVNAAKTGGDLTAEGREEERRDMFESAAGTALGILTAGDSEKDK